MDISGSHRIPAARAAVWAALRDPETLRACLPDCERLERTDDGAFAGIIAVKVGPIRTRISGTAEISAIDAPSRFVVSARGEDAAAGGGEGSGEVTLEENGDATVLDYSGRVEAHGKLSQLGQRLLSGVFRKTIETFAENLSARLAGAGFAAEPGLAPETSPPLPEAPPLVHEEPAEPSTPVLDAPPLSPGVPPPAPETPIAPTATPAVPDPAAIAAADVVEGQATGSSVTTRIMLVAAIVVVVGALIYYMLLQAPPG
ncbi:carbon monoxide dehydrogenase subunit G [Chelatococcus sambhunathii]|uniref:Carbon monoxide dehydrogenase subunit G n=1 Tax=Chelatococcus sambhunathii TaxID=363953 RepID=A0ABU1DLC5_9HYPH|nr:carbon monoxide dehydrogenase subunit G [Chelatococcus sambhunathii]MDR4308779.1 carbon monoxide dehydrogenase subunit G [Chelatococcus sambhunathii]